MKNRVRIIAALVVGLLLLAIPMASASTTTIQPAKRYGVCASLNPSLTVCY